MRWLLGMCGFGWRGIAAGGRALSVLPARNSGDGLCAKENLVVEVKMLIQ